VELSKEDLLALLKSKPRPDRIAALRSLYKLSQAGLARVAGVKRTTVSSWEAPYGRGEWGHEPGKMARQRMATFFGLPAYVFSNEWEGEPANQGGRPRKQSHPQEPTIQVPVPTYVKRIG